MASRGINKVILIGNLGQDPDVRYMPNGNAVANLSLATFESWKDKQTGEIREKTEWHKIVIFGKLAEIAGEYLSKGSQIYIEGSLQTRKWQDQTGQDRYTTEIVVNINGTMQMLNSRNNTQNKNINNNETEKKETKQIKKIKKYLDKKQTEKQNSDKTISKINDEKEDFDSDEDIPF